MLYEEIRIYINILKGNGKIFFRCEKMNGSDRLQYTAPYRFDRFAFDFVQIFYHAFMQL